MHRACKLSLYKSLSIVFKCIRNAVFSPLSTHWKFFSLFNSSRVFLIDDISSMGELGGKKDDLTDDTVLKSARTRCYKVSI